MGPGMRKSLLLTAALVFSSLLPACKRASTETSDVRVVQVPVPVGCQAPAAAQTDKPAAAAAPTLAKAEPAKPATAPSTKKADGSALRVKRLVVATDVDRSSRRPEGEATSFQKGRFEKLYAFVELENPAGESDIVVSFDPPSDKSEKGKVELAVGQSPSWRTWAFSRSFDETGEWTAIVRTKDGKELARTAFEVL